MQLNSIAIEGLNQLLNHDAPTPPPDLAHVANTLASVPCNRETWEAFHDGRLIVDNTLGPKDTRRWWEEDPSCLPGELFRWWKEAGGVQDHHMTPKVSVSGNTTMHTQKLAVDVLCKFSKLLSSTSQRKEAVTTRMQAMDKLMADWIDLLTVQDDENTL